MNLDPLKKRGLINTASCLSTEAYPSLTAEPERVGIDVNLSFNRRRRCS
jgi:hypothetical protein